MTHGVDDINQLMRNFRSAYPAIDENWDFLLRDDADGFGPIPIPGFHVSCVTDSYICKARFDAGECPKLESGNPT